MNAPLEQVTTGSPLHGTGLLLDPDFQRRFLDALFQGGSTAVLIASAEGTILRASRALERLSGYSQQELAGRPLALLQAPDVETHADSLHWKAMSQGERREGVINLRHADGRLAPLAAATFPVHDVQGAIAELVLVGVDLAKQTADSETRAVALQEPALDEDLIWQNLAHDFRNLLMGVKGCADLMMNRGGGDATSRQFLAEISRAASEGLAQLQQVGLLVHERRKFRHQPSPAGQR
jgi:PAS domain S-box-containing protein